MLIALIKLNFINICEGIPIFGVQFNCLQVVFDGLLYVVQLPEDIAKAVVGVFILFVDLYRLAIRLDGILVLVDGVKNIAKFVEGVLALGAHLDYALVALD